MPPLVSAPRADGGRDGCGDSSRGQTTATAISEVEEQETNNAPRRQKAPPPGMRPASLAEPEGGAGGDGAARRGAGTLRPSGADPRRLSKRPRSILRKPSRSAAPGAAAGGAVAGSASPSSRDCVITETMSEVVLARYRAADGCEW